MAPTTAPMDLAEAFAELQGTSDRATILVATSLVEYALEQAIASRLRKPVDDNEKAKLFSSRDGMLGSLFEKIWAAYFLKIIGPEARRNLDIIRRVRNYAAHNPNKADFKRTSEIASRCRELRFPVDKEEMPIPARDRFLFVSGFMAGILLLRSTDHIAEIADSSKELTHYLDR